MSPIRLKILGIDKKRDALTRKDGVESVTVEFDGEQACFLSWKSLRMMLIMKSEQGGGPDPLAAMTAINGEWQQGQSDQQPSLNGASIPVASPVTPILTT